jgi:TrmH family RNA methyltransferase
MGSAFHLKIHEQDLPETLKDMQVHRYTTLASDLDGIPLNKFNVNRAINPWGLVLGNEAHGINDDLNNFIDQKITIPGKGNIDSLNVAMAGSIVLYELTNINIV